MVPSQVEAVEECLVVVEVVLVVLSQAVVVAEFEVDELLYDLGREFGS